MIPNWRDVLKNAHRLLKPGGELYFSDVYADRRMPQALKEDQVLWEERLQKMKKAKLHRLLAYLTDTERGSANFDTKLSMLRRVAVSVARPTSLSRSTQLVRSPTILGCMTRLPFASVLVGRQVEFV